MYSMKVYEVCIVSKKPKGKYNLGFLKLFDLLN